jgi:DNA helicase HerA-like ATPase
MQLLFGLAAFVLQLPFSIRKDIARIKQLRYGRRLKGPVLVNGKEFTRAVTGNGIGFTTKDSKLPLRIPRDAENKHFLIVGNMGSGKSLAVANRDLAIIESIGPDDDIKLPVAPPPYLIERYKTLGKTVYVHPFVNDFAALARYNQNVDYQCHRTVYSSSRTVHGVNTV